MKEIEKVTNINKNEEIRKLDERINKITDLNNTECEKLKEENI